MKLTREQRVALCRVWARTVHDTEAYKLEVFRAQNSLHRPVFRLRHSAALMRSYRQFRRKAQPTFFCDDCVMVPFAGMWLGIERDGNTHS